MFEFEDMSSGFHDVFLNKYADSSGPILDFYISDSMQDMLDIDIRTEVATVVGGVNEFTSLINDLPSLDLDINSQDGDISWLGGPKWSATNDIYADVGACVNPNSVMPIIQSSLLNSQKSHINLNTNSYQNNHNNSPLPSPKEKKSHLTFSPNQIKVPSIIHDNIKQRSAYLQQTVGGQQQQQQKMTTTTTSNGIRNHQQNHNLHHHHQQQQQHNIDNVKKDLINDLKDEKLLLTNKKIGIQSNILSSGSNTIKLAPGIGGLTFANSLSYAKLKQTSTNNGHISSSSSVNGSLLTTQQQNKRERDSSSSSSCSPHHQNIYTNNNNNNTNNNNHHQKSLSRNILVQNKNNITNGIHLSISQQHQHHHQQQQQHHQQNNNNNNSHITKNNKQKIEQQISEYPKPPYSYSCLIAMALKNSRSGSLPVSEIYSFMCEHFPYFKTAPNGWKNSVRHNLSLNKCFEKIEKPTTNGGQRKGCLWAMNPTKITKMDEEVQKWSRKDPMAIRKAMVYPEHLESLERGEMKHGSSGDSDADENEVQSDIEENSDSEEQDDVVETSESVGGDDEDDEQEKEFEIEVTDIYDNIDLNDNKELLRMAIRQNELGEYIENDIPSSKRARLDINYSIGPAGAFDHNSHHQIQQRSSSSSSSSQQQQQHHNRRKMQLVNRIA